MTRHERLMLTLGETDSKKVDSLIRQGWTDQQILSGYQKIVIDTSVPIIDK